MRPSFRWFAIVFLIGLGACAAPVRPAIPKSPPALAGSSPLPPTPMPSPATVAATSAASAGTTTTTPVPDPAVLDEFVATTAAATGRAPQDIRDWLAQARYQQGIIDAITRPAEAKPWKDYRPIFLTADRIARGREFFAANRDALLKVQADTGVPAELIVAIIGVETNYGKITGNYRVLDALYTLGFFYPRRGEFFRSELAQLFALASEERLDLATVKGSYAGAMGWGQFMPSSYRNYGRDGDGDHRRDLFASLPDVFASIANYFVGYGWRSGQPIFATAVADAGVAPFVPEDYQSRYSLAELAAKGYRPADPAAPDLPATLLTLDGADGPEYWIGYPNFYVLTRYNRSPLYAMAVFQLSREIAAGASNGDDATAASNGR